MTPQRVAVFVDGFNLYHALKALREEHLKWLSLRKLSEVFAPAPQFTIDHIFYFSAYATWLPDALIRHRKYISALEAEGIAVVLGNFKKKDRKCFACNASWKDHEEKETDVNIALSLLDGAYRNIYDRALILSADSDLAPAIRMVRDRFPEKSIRLLIPMGRTNISELVSAVGGPKAASKIKRLHLERCLLPESISDKNGRVIHRPAKYTPPS